jgi:hypothetical protein
MTNWEKEEKKAAIEKLDEVENETNRFLKKLNDYKDELNATGWEYVNHKRAAMKRASLDLSKMLSEFRKNKI